MAGLVNSTPVRIPKQYYAELLTLKHQSGVPMLRLLTIALELAMPQLKQRFKHYGKKTERTDRDGSAIHPRD